MTFVRVQPLVLIVIYFKEEKFCYCTYGGKFVWNDFILKEQVSMEDKSEMVVYEKARMSKFNLLCFQIGCYCIVQTYIIQKRTIKFNFLRHPTFLGVETHALAF